MSEYDKQAQDFLNKYGLKATSTYLTEEIPKWDQGDYHSKFRLKVTRIARIQGRTRHLTCNWYQSIAQGSESPTAYDILATLSSESYLYDDFEDFCSSFGYSTDSIKALETFKAVKKLSTRINDFFTEEELEALREIN